MRAQSLPPRTGRLVGRAFSPFHTGADYRWHQTYGSTPRVSAMRISRGEVGAASGADMADRIWKILRCQGEAADEPMMHWHYIKLRQQRRHLAFAFSTAASASSGCSPLPLPPPPLSKRVTPPLIPSAHARRRRVLRPLRRDKLLRRPA